MVFQQQREFCCLLKASKGSVKQSIFFFDAVERSRQVLVRDSDENFLVAVPPLLPAGYTHNHLFRLHARRHIRVSELRRKHGMVKSYPYPTDEPPLDLPGAK